MVGAGLWQSRRQPERPQTRGDQGQARVVPIFLKEVLGASASAARLGVIGESGDLPDIWRERQRQMLVARQMLRAPAGSLPRRMAEGARSGEVKLGIFRLVAEILCEQQTVRDISSFDSKKSIKEWVRRQATKEWLQSAS